MKIYTIRAKSRFSIIYKRENSFSYNSKIILRRNLDLITFIYNFKSYFYNFHRCKRKQWKKRFYKFFKNYFCWYFTLFLHYFFNFSWLVNILIVIFLQFLLKYLNHRLSILFFFDRCCICNVPMYQRALRCIESQSWAKCRVIKQWGNSKVEIDD